MVGNESSAARECNLRTHESHVKTVISRCCEHKRIISKCEIFLSILIDSDDDDAEPR